MANTDQYSNFARISNLIIEVGGQTLRNLFKKKWKENVGIEWDITIKDEFGKTCVDIFFDKERSPLSYLTTSQIHSIRHVTLDKWDVTLLALVMTNSAAMKKFPLAKAQLRAVNYIRYIRNDHFHSGTIQLTSDDYTLVLTKLQRQIIQLGGSKAEIGKVINGISTTKEIQETVKEPYIPRDPRLRLIGWLDSHFVGSNRRKMHGFDSLGDHSYINTLSNLENHGQPAIRLMLKPEGIELPLIFSETHVIIGSRKLLERELENGDIADELVNKRWILGVDDDKLTAEHLRIVYQTEQKRWLVEHLSQVKNTCKCYFTAAKYAEKQEFNSGKFEVLGVGCTVYFGSHRIKVSEMFIEASLKNEKSLTSDSTTDIIPGGENSSNAIFTSETLYIPSGNLYSSSHRYDLVDQSASQCGSFGSVYQVNCSGKKQGNTYALKCPLRLESENIDLIEWELEVCMACKLHPGIIGLVDFFVFHDIPHLILPWASGGALDTWLEADDETPCQLSLFKSSFVQLSACPLLCRILDIILQITSALSYAHQLGFVHADIKPSNILVSQFRPKCNDYFLDVILSDFGISGRVEPSSGMLIRRAGRGSLIFQSPEQCHSENINNKTDVWSLAILLEYLSSKCTHDAADFSTLQAFKLLVNRANVKDGEELLHNFLNCLNVSTNHRPTTKEISGFIQVFLEKNCLSNNELEIFDFPIIKYLHTMDITAERRKAYSTVEGTINDLIVMAEFYEKVKKNTAKAKTLWIQIIQMTEDCPIPAVFNAYAMFLEGFESPHLDEIEKYYMKAFDIDPNNEIILTNYGEFLFNKRRNLNQAEVIFRRAMNVENNTGRVLGTYALLLEEKKDYISAGDIYKLGIQLDPSNSIRLRNYAHYCENYLGDFKQAEQMYSQAIKVDPNNPQLCYEYGDLLETLQDVHGAIAQYKKALVYDAHHIGALNNYAQALFSLGQYDQLSLDLLERALEVDPNHLQCLGNYSHILRKQRKYENCKAVIDKALSIDSGNSSIWIAYGQLMTDWKSDYKSADVYFRNAVQYGPDNQYALYHLGQNLLAHEEGNIDAAINYLSRAEVIDPSNESIKEILQQARTTKKLSQRFNPLSNVQYAECSADVRSTVSSHKKDGNDFFRKKEYVEALRKYTEGLLSLSKIETKDKDVDLLRVSIYNNIAACHQQLNNSAQVVRNCTKALEIDSSNLKSLYRRALASEQQNEIYFALQDISKCRQLCITDKAINEAYHRISNAQLETSLPASNPVGIPQSHEPVLFGQLRLGIVHYKLCVIGSIVSDAWKMGGIHFNMIDDACSTISVSVYCFDKRERVRVVPDQTRLKATELAESYFELENVKNLGFSEGRKICILDPFYKRRADGSLGLRVDDRNCLIFL